MLFCSLVPWKLWDLFSSKIPYARGVGEEGFQALSAVGTVMIWGRSRHSWPEDQWILSDSSVSTSGNRGDESIFFFFFCCHCKQKSQWALSWILAQEISAHLPSETQVSSGNPPEAQARWGPCREIGCYVFHCGNCNPWGQSRSTQAFSYNPPGISPCCSRHNCLVIPEASSYSFHIKITSCIRHEI